MLYKTVTSVLLGDTHSLPGFEETSCHVVSCHVERATKQGAEGHKARSRGQTLAYSRQETETLRLEFCKEWKAASSRMNLEAYPSPGKPSMRPQPWKTL